MKPEAKSVQAAPLKYNRLGPGFSVAMIKCRGKVICKISAATVLIQCEKVPRVGFGSLGTLLRVLFKCNLAYNLLAQLFTLKCVLDTSFIARTRLLHTYGLHRVVYAPLSDC